MKTSEDGLDLIRSFEGFRASAYKDSAGHLTIGYGHKVLPEEDFTKDISIKEAEVLLQQDVLIVEDAIDDFVKVPLNKNQRDALASWTYNLGRTALATSTLLKVLNAGNYDAVPEQILRWNKATDLATGEKKVIPGLARRREAECAAWNTHTENEPVKNTQKFKVKVYAISGMAEVDVEASNEEAALTLAEQRADQMKASEFLEPNIKTLAVDALLKND